jgi:aspartate aminotransferase/aminotransferase
MDFSKLLADRTRRVEFSGIRKYFEMARRMKDPCDLSIGQPDYDTPEEVKRAAIEAIRRGENRYTPTAGNSELVQRLREEVRAAHQVDASVLVTSGVSGGLLLSLLAVVDPGDEVIILDPYFVSYLQLLNLVGGTPVRVDTYPDFRFDASAVEAVVTPRTKALIINSPANPTGRTMTPEEVAHAARIARKHDLLLISDEIYDRLCYDEPNSSPLALAPENTILLRGFGKTYGMTGWRMGYAAGPQTIINEMTKLHQYTYVCAPSMAQAAALTALVTDVSNHREAYARKRDLVCDLLSSGFEFVRPTGGFYVFPKAPARFPGAAEFCEAAAAQGVLVIPGCAFSARDTHFRISYATSDTMIRRGCAVLCGLAAR